MTVRLYQRIRIVGVNPFVAIPRSVAARLRAGWKRPMPVCFRVNRKPIVPWRLNLTPVGDGTFRLHLNGAVRSATGTSVGDRIEVELEFDCEYRGGPAHPMPAMLDEGLSRSPRARASWESLRPSLKKEFLRYIASLKSENARARNVGRALEILNGAEGRFLGRSWRAGREVADR